MSDNKAKGLIFGSAIFLILIGVFLYKLFDYQGYNDVKEKNTYINYDVNDYTIVSEVTIDNYSDVFSDIDINRVSFKNINSSLVKDFINKEEELISYVKRYYNEIKKEEYTNNNKAYSKVKTIVNGTILSVYYEMEFVFDDTMYKNNIKNYIITFNIDLKTMKVLSNDDLLNKYNYTKEYIGEKIYNDDILISDNEVLIDKDTNISLTKKDIERKKKEYVNRVVTDFDNIIKLYVERDTLVLVYDTKDIKNLFFNDEFGTNIKIRYLK